MANIVKQETEYILLRFKNAKASHIARNPRMRFRIENGDIHVN